MKPGPRPLAFGLAACVALAAISLLAPFEPVYDPWAWLVWGRELADFDLDTSAGPSWKPLPALVAAPLSALGDAAPEAWLLVGRTGWLAVPLLAGLLAFRLAGSPGRRAALAGLLAGAGTLLFFDGTTAWARQGAGGLSEPLLTAVVLGAVIAALEGRGRLALVLGGVACLLRPEAWPFALAYGWWLRSTEDVGSGTLAAGAAAIAALWFVPDALGAGDALEGAERARGADGTAPEVLWRALRMPLAVVWPGVALTVWRRRLPPPIVALTAGAAAWIAVVALMAAAGFAGLPRFLAPAVAVLCAVGSTGLVRGITSIPRARAAVAALVALAFLADAGWRAAEIPGDLRDLRDDSETTRELTGLAAREPDAFAGCGSLWTSDLLTQTALAWQVDRGLAEVVVTRSVAPPRGRLVVGRRTGAELVARVRRRDEPIARAGGWEVYGTGDCAASSGEPR